MVNSGLVLNFDITWGSDCKSLIFTEKTGINSSSNPTGWGVNGASIHPTIASALTATLLITLQDGTVLPEIDLYSTFPSSDTLAPTWVILNTDLGYASTDAIPSQVMTFLYTVTGDDGTVGEYSEFTSKQLPILCTLECCVAGFAADVDFCGCNSSCSCGNPSLDKFNNVWGYIEAIKDAFICQPPKVDKAIKIIEYLNDICSGDCGCSC